MLRFFQRIGEKCALAGRMMQKLARQQTSAAHTFSIARFRRIRHLLGAILNRSDNRGSPSLSAMLMGQDDWPVAGKNGSAIQNSRSRRAKPARSRKAKDKVGGSRSARQGKRPQPPGAKQEK